jgi:hypothetical protein
MYLGMCSPGWNSSVPTPSPSGHRRTYHLLSTGRGGGLGCAREETIKKVSENKARTAGAEPFFLDQKELDS